MRCRENEVDIEALPPSFIACGASNASMYSFGH